MEYQIPISDGRYLTLRYDEDSQQTLLTIPEDADGQRSADLTPEQAEQLVNALGEVYTRATGEPPPAAH